MSSSCPHFHPNPMMVGRLRPENTSLSEDNSLRGPQCGEGVVHIIGLPFTAWQCAVDTSPLAWPLCVNESLSFGPAKRIRRSKTNRSVSSWVR